MGVTPKIPPVLLTRLGLLQRAKEGLLSVLTTDSENPFSLAFLGQMALYRWDYDEAEEYHLRAFHVDPTNIWAHLFHPVALYRAQLEEAAERIQAARQLMPDDPGLQSCEALLSAKRGEFRKAEQLIQKALRGGKPLLHAHYVSHTAAAAHVLLGKPARVIKLLRKASSMGLPNYPVFCEDPRLHSLRERSEYLGLMAELKRDWAGYRIEFGRR